MTLTLSAMLRNPETGYAITSSMLFNGASYLTRTPLAGDDDNWTVSMWVKRAELNASLHYLFSADSGSAETGFGFSSSENIVVDFGATVALRTGAVYRDPSSWMHLVLAAEIASGTASSRLTVYVNGEQVSSYDTDNRASLSAGSALINDAVRHNIGRWSAGDLFHGYMTEVIFVDGQVLAASDFGETVGGVWVPKSYTGTFGGNGFYLDGSSANDQSGNGNDWTVNNGVIFGLVESPTDDANAGLGNYPVFNEGIIPQTGIVTFYSGGTFLSAQPPGAGVPRTAVQTTGVSKGKWYWEVNPCEGTYNANFRTYYGITDDPMMGGATQLGSTAGSYCFSTSGGKINNGSETSYGTIFPTSPSTTAVVGVALDLDIGAIWFHQDGVWQAGATVTEIETGNVTNAAFSGLNGQFFPAIGGISRGLNMQIDHYPDTWVYAPPSGFKAINTANMPDNPTVTSDHAAIALYTGNGVSNSSGGNAITGVGFQPDFVWIKDRDIANSHHVYDRIRGATNYLLINNNNAEAVESEGLSSFDSDGFTVGNSFHTGTSGDNYWALCLKADGAGVSNTDGSVTSTVSANTTSGFSIVQYTGNGTSGATVGHGLGVAPEFIMVKTLVSGNWSCYHRALGGTQQVQLNTTGAASSASSIWNDTDPSNSVVTLGNASGTNGSGNDFIMYCFAGIDVLDTSIFRIGSFEGNSSSDGAFSNQDGFPLFNLWKLANTTSSWWMVDTVRDTINPRKTYLFADTNQSESTAGGDLIDFVSNGIKCRTTGRQNTSGQETLYLSILADRIANNNRAR